MSSVISGFYDAIADGAPGDGSTDVTLALQNELAKCQAGGGGIVYLGPGVFMVHLTQNPNVPSVYAALHLPSNVTLQGAGPGTTIIRLVAGGALDQQRMVTNWNPQASGTDANICVKDLCLDGNASNQTVGSTLSACDGFNFSYVTGLSFQNVISKNHIGTTGGSPGPSGQDGESHAYYLSGCQTVKIKGCVASADAGNNVSTGFGLAYGYDYELSDCSASNLAYGNAYPVFRVNGLTFTNCLGYNCPTGAGWFLEQSNYIEVTNCQAGGITPAAAQAGTLPAGTILPMTKGFVAASSSFVHFTNCLALKCSQDGFKTEIAGSDPGVNSTNVLFVNCRAESCSKNGWRVQDASKDIAWMNCEAINCGTSGDHGFYICSTDTTGVFLLEGCRANNNIDYGFAYTTPGLPLHLVNCQAQGNTHALLRDGGVSYNSLDGVVTAPAVPASGTALTNPLPFPVTIVVHGGAVSQIAIGGTNLYITSGAVRLGYGQSIVLTYTTAPSWVWIAD